MKRNPTVDMAKTFAILMMIFGHSIQYGQGQAYLDSMGFAQNVVYEYIYSFHMPLFAILSGYLFYFSISKRDLKNIVINRVTNLLIPIIGWQLISSCFRILAAGVLKGRWDFGLLIRNYFLIYNNMWFLWAMLVCSCVVIVVRCFFKDNLMMYILAALVSFCLKFYKLQMWLWLLPFFVFGYFVNKHKDTLSAQFGNSLHMLAAVCAVIHIVLVYFWKNEYYIYESMGRGLYIFRDDNVWYAVFVNLYRLVSGFAGSITWIYISYLLGRFIKENGWIHRFILCSSKYSIGIYVISVYIFDKILQYLTEPLSYNIFMAALETVLIMFGSIVSMILINKWSVSRRILLGGR